MKGTTLVLSLAFTFLTGCSQMTSLAPVKGTSNIIPVETEEVSLFTRRLYESISNRVDQVQLYVKNDVNFKYVKDINSTGHLTIKNGRVIENSGTVTSEIFLKAGTPVTAGVEASSPSTLSVNVGGKIVHFSNFKITAKDKEIAGYPNNAGGVYFPEACTNKNRTQKINDVTYELTTPCNSILVVKAAHVIKKEYNVINPKGKVYTAPKRNNKKPTQ